MLALLVRLRRSPVEDRGTWPGGLALAAYAVAFTYAYTRIGAAVGALLLFGAVQATMIGTGLVRGERPARIDWLGVGLAIAGLLALTLPGATAPDALGAALMLVAGAAWGWYSLLGRGSRDPIAVTSGNFWRATMLGLAVTVWLLPQRVTTGTGVWLAIASGAIASGLGYSLWYAALPSLPAWRAAVAQLAVPVLTALLAAWILGESIPFRLVGAASLVIAGVSLTVVPAWHRRLTR
jgi:drug/metabolite transporter (DMT)-like permease